MCAAFHILSPQSPIASIRQSASLQSAQRIRKWTIRLGRARRPSHQLPVHLVSATARVHHIESESMSAQFERHPFRQSTFCYAFRRGSRSHGRRVPATEGAGEQLVGAAGAKRRRSTHGAGRPYGWFDDHGGKCDGDGRQTGVHCGRRTGWRR